MLGLAKPSEGDDKYSVASRESAQTQQTPTSNQGLSNSESILTYQDRVRREKISAYASINKEGDVLDGNYLLNKCVGSGGIGSVWKAYDYELRRFVAIKFLHRHLASHQAIERFSRGARKMAKLDHPFITKVYGNKPKTENPYFVMEFIDGLDLEAAVTKRMVSTAEAVEYVLQVGEALAYAHNEKLIHRDVKPSNVLIDLSRKRPRLADFDLVKADDTEGFTRTSPLGSWLYAAPEAKISGRDVDVRADIYSLAMTFIFALNSGISLEAANDPQAFLAEVGCTESLRSVLEIATSQKREDRYESMDLFLTAIRQAMKEDQTIEPSLQIALRRLRKPELVELASVGSTLLDEYGINVDVLSNVVKRILGIFRGSVDCIVALVNPEIVKFIGIDSTAYPTQWSSEFASQALTEGKPVAQSLLVNQLPHSAIYAPIVHRHHKAKAVLYVKIERQHSDADLKLVELLAKQFVFPIVVEYAFTTLKNIDGCKEIVAGIRGSEFDKDFVSTPHFGVSYSLVDFDSDSSVGGDVFRLRRRKNGNIVVMLADAVGSSLSAAFISLPLISTFDMLLDMDSPLQALVETLNRALTRYNWPRFITALVLEFDFHKNQLLCVNAGHCQPTLLKEGKVLVDSWGGEERNLPLGIVDDAQFGVVSANMKDFDAIFAFTDGLPESMDMNNKLLGESGIARLLRTRPVKYSLDFAPSFTNAVKRRNGKGFDDDVLVALIWWAACDQDVLRKN